MPETAQKSNHSTSNIQNSSFGQSPAPTQPLLFDVPSLAETAVWCTLTDGIDPAQWAGACRYLGSLTPDQFQDVQKKLFPANKSTFNIIHSKFFSNPDSLFSRIKRVFSFNQSEVAHLPLVSIGPDRIIG